MTSELKNLAKIIEEEKYDGKKEEIVFKYVMTFQDWIQSFVGVEKKRLIFSQKSHVFKYIKLITKLAIKNDKSIVMNFSQISYVMNILITPGNDPEIRREIVTSSFDIITSMMSVIPAEAWQDNFFKKAFTYPCNNYEKNCVKIGDNRPPSQEDIVRFSNTVVERIQQISDKERSVFNYWWRVLAFSIIPNLFAENSQLDGKSKEEIQENIYEIFAKDIEKPGSKIFMDEIENQSVTRASQISFHTKYMFDSAILVLNYILKNSKLTQKFSKYTECICNFFDNIFGIKATEVDPDKNSILSIPDSDLTFIYSGKREIKNFTMVTCTPERKMKIIVSMISNFSDENLASLRKLFYFAFSFYMHLYDIYLDTKDEEERKMVFQHLIDQYLLTMKLSVEIMKQEELQDYVLETISKFNTLYIQVVVIYLFTMMINLKSFDKEKFMNVLVRIPATNKVIEIIELFSSVVAFEDFRNKTNNKKISNLNATYEVLKDPTSMLSYASFSCKSGSTFIAAPNSMVTMSREKMSTFVEDFFSCTECITKCIGQLAYSEVWILLMNKYDVDEDVVSCEHIYDVIVPNAIEELVARQKTLPYIRSIALLMSSKEIYYHLDKEVVKKMVLKLSTTAKTENTHEMLTVIVDSCIRLIKLGDVRVFGLVEDLISAINKILENKELSVNDSFKYLKNLVDLINIASSLPQNKFLKISDEVGLTILNTTNNLALNRNFEEESAIINFVFISTILIYLSHDTFISSISSLLPSLRVNEVYKMLPLLAEIIKVSDKKSLEVAEKMKTDVNEKVNSLTGRIIKPLEQLRDSKDPNDEEKLFNISLTTALTLMEVKDNNDITDFCINYISMKYGKLSYILFSEVFGGREMPFNIKNESNNYFHSFKDRGNGAISLTTKNSCGRQNFEIMIEQNESIKQNGEKNSHELPFIYLKNLLFPNIDYKPNDMQKYLFKERKGILLYAKRGQKSIDEAMSNNRVSKQFIDFAKSIGKIQKTGEIDWNFYLYHLTLKALPFMKEGREELVDKKSKPFAVIWDESNEALKLSRQRFKRLKCAIVVKPFTNGFVLLSLHKFNSFKALTCPLIDTMIVTKKLLPIYLRWTIISICNNLK